MKKKTLIILLVLLIIIVLGITLLKFNKQKDVSNQNEVSDIAKYKILKGKEILKSKLIEVGNSLWSDDIIQDMEKNKENYNPVVYTMTLKDLDTSLDVDFSLFQQNNCNFDKSRLQAIIIRDDAGYKEYFLNSVLICEKYETNEEISFDSQDFEKLTIKDNLEKKLIEIGEGIPVFQDSEEINYNRHDSLNYFDLYELENMFDYNISELKKENCDERKSRIQVIFFDTDKETKEIYFNPVLICQY